MLYVYFCSQSTVFVTYKMLTIYCIFRHSYVVLIWGLLQINFCLLTCMKKLFKKLKKSQHKFRLCFFILYAARHFVKNIHVYFGIFITLLCFQYFSVFIT